MNNKENERRRLPSLLIEQQLFIVIAVNALPETFVEII